MKINNEYAVFVRFQHLMFTVKQLVKLYFRIGFSKTVELYFCLVEKTDTLVELGRSA